MPAACKERLAKRRSAGNFRELILPNDLIDFASNDYLGVAKSCRLMTAPMSGSTGSRLLTGNSSYAEALEKKIAEFHGFETALLFNCGFMANGGLLSAIAGDNDVIFFDQEVHASTRIGLKLTLAKSYPFKHNDLDHLERRLQRSACLKERFIAVEAIYSTNGSLAPLRGICQLAEKYEASVIVDEAHSVGIIGSMGRGAVAAHRLTGSVFANVVTFGKAFGAFGAAILGSRLLKESLINFAPSYIYTTALPFSVLHSIDQSYEIMAALEKERHHLSRLIEMFPHSSGTPIQSHVIGGNLAVKKAAERLKRNGFDVRPLMSPTVQRGGEALRICLHSFNTEEEVKRLCELL